MRGKLLATSSARFSAPVFPGSGESTTCTPWTTPGDVGRRVRAAVGGHDHLELARERVPQHGVEGSPDHGGLVVRGDDHRRHAVTVAPGGCGGAACRRCLTTIGYGALDPVAGRRPFPTVEVVFVWRRPPGAGPPLVRLGVGLFATGYLGWFVLNHVGTDYQASGQMVFLLAPRGERVTTPTNPYLNLPGGLSTVGALPPVT